jgi:hypothetical protein
MSTLDGRAERIAAARVRDAAPEMLEAAKRLLELGIINPTGSAKYDAAIKALIAAVCKAEGAK